MRKAIDLIRRSKAPHAHVWAEDGILTVAAVAYGHRVIIRHPTEEANFAPWAFNPKNLPSIPRRASTRVAFGPAGTLTVDGAKISIPHDARGSFVEPKAAAPIGTVTYDVAQLRDALAYVTPAISPDHSRGPLRSLVFHEDRLLATDGHRLHLARGLPAFPSTEVFPLDAEAVPTLDVALRGAKTATATLRDKGIVSWEIDDGHVTIDASINGAPFPNYERLLTHPPQGVISRAELLDYVATAALVAPKLLGKDRKITLETEDVTLWVKGGDQGWPVLWDGPHLCKIHVNSRYLAEAIKGMGEEVSVGWAGKKGLDPLRFDDGAKTAIVMPTR